MPTDYQQKNFATWYLLNLLGWAVGFSGGFNLAIFYWLSIAIKYPFSSVIYKLGDVSELLFPLFGLIVCLGLAQWLKFRQWKVTFSVGKWIVANIQGTFIAFIALFIIGPIIGALQRPILEFLYGDVSYSAQTPFILTLISVLVPLFGSIGTSIMVAKDILHWKFGKNNATWEA